MGFFVRLMSNLTKITFFKRKSVKKFNCFLVI
jgi:hypothetical protein